MNLAVSLATQESTPVHSDLYSYNDPRTIGNSIEGHCNTIKQKHKCEYFVLYSAGHT